MHGPPLSLSDTPEPEVNLQEATAAHTRRRTVYFALGFLSVLIAISGIYVFRLIRAVQVFALLQKKPRPLRIYDRFFGHGPIFTDTTIPGSAGLISVRIYAPANKPDSKPVVMVHGLVPYGNRDGYLDAVAENLAELGYMVVIPNLPAETHFEMRTSDLTVICDAIRWTAKAKQEKVAVLGASFGGGLAIAAALQPSVVQDVKLIFSLSGYYNLDSIARFYIRDPVYDPSGHEYVGDPPGPLLIMAQYLGELVPAKDVKPLEHELNLLKRRQGFQFTDRDPSVARLTEDQRRKLNALQTVGTKEVHQAYMDILKRHSQDIAAMSPSSVLSRLSVPLYVLHGQNDRVLPEGEVEWMRKRLANNPNLHILVTPWIGHATIGQPATLLQKIAVARFGARILKQISMPVPLR